jgi:hypothetical protein
METEAYINKYIKQPSQLCAKHVYAKKHHVDNKMQCMQINKYDHEHDGGSKEKIKLRLISHKFIIIKWCHYLFSLRKE